MNKHPKKKKKQPLIKMAQVVSTVLLICCTLLCFMVVLNAAVAKDANLFGFRLFYVVTGSMEPTLPVGSLLVVGQTDHFEVGDVITFYSREESIAGYPNTHRIIGIQGTGAERSFLTKGDFNAVADTEPVPLSDVIGKVYFSIDGGFIKKLVELLGTPMGFFTVILLPILVVAVIAMKDFRKAMQEELRRAAMASLQEEKTLGKETLNDGQGIDPSE